jgi:formate/nitrite transporter FocA (FNT family)
LLLSGLSAGREIGFSPFLTAFMQTLVAGQLSKPVAEILGANMYAIGFIYVVLGRSELFTEQTTLAVLPVLYGRSSLLGLVRMCLASAGHFIFRDTLRNIVGGSVCLALLKYSHAGWADE